MQLNFQKPTENIIVIIKKYNCIENTFKITLALFGEKKRRKLRFIKKFSFNYKNMAYLIYYI